MDNGRGAEWVKPRRRALIPLGDRFTISRSLAARVRSNRFTVLEDTAFARVIRACAEPAPGRQETWLNPTIIEAFEVLHQAGHAHSVEAWLPSPGGPVLVGGLYGLAIGGAFCGESMFSRPDLGGTDASKVCLVHLVEHLRRRQFVILDAQIMNPHIARFGAYEVPSREYDSMLAAAVTMNVTWE